ncbi:helix-turn-helix domain-containing protein [Geothrix sp. 21YS21S-4]|uniref:helix-turn-helix domain-containing protein n=1 Tax=Geothrix sp. 21YS21S-4 TaxID=3068889 RepID=UPI00359376D0
MGHRGSPGEGPEPSGAAAPGCFASVGLRPPIASHPGGWISSFSAPYCLSNLRGGRNRTAKRKAAVVLDLIKGKITAADAARQHGLTVAELEQWKDDFLSQGTDVMTQ